MTDPSFTFSKNPTNIPKRKFLSSNIVIKIERDFYDMPLEVVMPRFYTPSEYRLESIRSLIAHINTCGDKVPAA